VASPTEQDQWKAIRTSVKETGDRFAEMVSSARDPQAKVTTSWSVAVTAAHVTAVAWLDAALLRPDEVPPPIPDLADRLTATTVDGINDLNDVALHHFTERQPKALADLLRDYVARILDSSEGRDPAEPITWVGGAQLPLIGLFAHLLNEMLIHGYDIARVTGTQWTISPRDAGQFFEQFIVGLARNGTGRLLDGGGTPRDRRVAVEFLSDHTTPVTLVLRNGRVTAEPPGHDIDVRVSFDPVTFNLMMFGRVGKPRAVLTRKVVVGGRRPWLLPVFLRTVRVPS
jgi:uncharacterized protein (TIGR03083 family)